MGGNASKVGFEAIVKQLTTKEVNPTDYEFWDEMWKTTLSVDQIFLYFPPDDVRKLIKDRPGNLKTLFTQAVAQLFQVVETPYPVYFDQALNCTRILSRVLPFMLESDSEAAKNLCWRRQALPKPITPLSDLATAGTGPSTGGDMDGESKTEVPSDVRESEPLAVVLVNAMFHLLFLPEFTIEDPKIDFSEADIGSQSFRNALMWAPGIGSNEKSVVSSTEYDKNRIEVLRVMIAAFSDSLYQSPDTYDSSASTWLEVATSSDAPYAEIVLFSLMNTVLGYDPVGWGLPYGNFVATDTAKPLMESAVQALIILLDYGHPIKPPSEGQEPVLTGDGAYLSYVRADDIEAEGFNVFRRILGTIEEGSQLNFIYRGFVRLLNNVHLSESSYLPFSVTRMSIEQELLVLFWKCLEEIPKFMPFILRQCDVTELLVPLCYLMLEGRKDPSKVGLMYLCTFTLLKLSGERSFGVTLNQPYQLTLPVDVPPFSGNYSDLLVIVLHKMIVSGLDKLSALYNCFLTIICNVSPYCKCLGTVAAVKIVNLFQLFASPRFMYAAESNSVYIALILETLNNIVQYQYEGNVNIVYAIIKRKELFESLAGLTLQSAIKTALELADRRLEKQNEKMERSRASEKGKSVNGDQDDDDQSIAPHTDLITTAAIERRNGDIDGEHVDRKLTPKSKDNARSPTSQKVKHSGLRFMPTESWLQTIKADAPMNTLMRLLRHLVPQVSHLAQDPNGVDELQIIQFIKKTTMVGLLPVPHPIIIRKYQPNRYTCLWFTAFQWGVIFMHNQTVPLFDGKKVKLFTVQTLQ